MPGSQTVAEHSALLDIYAINDAMNQLILAHLDRRAWRATLQGKEISPEDGTRGGKKTSRTRKRGGRTIAAIIVHMHNCRVNWLRRTAPHLKRSRMLDPHRCTMPQAVAALKKSGEQCLHMLQDALSQDPERKIRKFTRDSWMPVWPANATMFAYMFFHEAHHRGQILMLAHQLGYRLPVPGSYGIWHWDKLWKQAGLSPHRSEKNPMKRAAKEQ